MSLRTIITMTSYKVTKTEGYLGAISVRSVIQFYILMCSVVKKESHIGERAPFQCVIKYITNLLLIDIRVERYLLHKRNFYDYGWFKS